ncbi:MAG: hypothetical protein OER74_13660 [Desulfobacteraceae bacterium]|nr:hypothetical protein [Desulfobacteraceae bacterium]
MAYIIPVVRTNWLIKTNTADNRSPTRVIPKGGDQPPEWNTIGCAPCHTAPVNQALAASDRIMLPSAHPACRRCV